MTDYQKVLDQVYGVGNVFVLERYINKRAVILHHCTVCSKDFYQRPSWAIRLDRKHECNTRYPITNNHAVTDRPKVKTPKRLSPEEVQEVVKLGKEGKSVSEVARLFEVKPSKIRYQFTKHGLIDRTG